jgi:hypothetical protein
MGTQFRWPTGGESTGEHPVADPIGLLVRGYQHEAEGQRKKTERLRARNAAGADGEILVDNRCRHH